MHPGKQQALSTGSYLQDSSGQLIYSFVDNKQTSGNPCLLFAGRLGDNTLATTSHPHSYCLSSIPEQTDGEQYTITLQCYAPNGTAIRCCGHGLLAAAHYWTQALDTDQLSFVMGDEVINSVRRNSCLWLQFAPVVIDRCELPAWIDVFIGQSLPIAAATVGDKHGYLILQWPDASDLSQIDIAINRIAGVSQRAVICTAAQLDEDTDTVQLRYFAPQYGVPEDTATGSAMRILAAYWAQRFESIRAIQRSARGGVLYSRYLPNCIEVGGYCLTAATNMDHGND